MFTPDDTLAMNAFFAWLKKHPDMEGRFNFNEMMNCWAVEIRGTRNPTYRCAVEPSLAIAVRKALESSEARIR